MLYFYRYWINICQGIHDGPDTGVCSDSSASCRRMSGGQVDSLGVVTSQALTMEGRQHILYSMPNKKKHIMQHTCKTGQGIRVIKHAPKRGIVIYVHVNRSELGVM